MNEHTNEGSMKRTGLLMLGLGLAGIPAASPGHPNEPAGFVVLRSWTGDSLPTSQWVGSHPDNPSVVVDATSPEGSKNVGQIKFPAGFPSGSAPAGLEQVGAYSVKPRSIYISFWIKLSSNWVGNASGANKILYLNVDGGQRGSIEFIGMGGLDGTNQIIAPMVVLNNLTQVTPGAGSSGSPSVTLVPNQVPYTASSQYTRGTWGHYEVLLTLNSSPGVADGGAKWWFNGKLYGDFSGHVDWKTTPRSGFTQVYWEPTYGGAGPAVPADQYMWMKNLYVSGK